MPENTSGTATMAEKSKNEKRVCKEAEISRGTASIPTRDTGSARPMAHAACAVRCFTDSAGKSAGRSCTTSAPSVSPNMLMETATNAR